MRNVITCSPASRSRKALLLGSASALALCVAVPSIGWTSEDPAPETNGIGLASVTGYTTVFANPSNLSVPLSAMITNDIGGIVGAGSSAITTANSFTASVGGNDVTNTISGTTLPLPNGSDLSNDGVAVLNNSLNIGVVANARVGNSVLAQEILASAMAATVSSNTMSASVTLNQSTTTVQGQVPLNYAADGAFTTPPVVYNGATSSVAGGYDAIGSVLATTAQFNNNSGQLNGSKAMVTENQIGETITGAVETPAILSGSPAVTGNSMTAGFIGNAATTALSLNAGGAPSFNGSTALTNDQQNFTAVGNPDPASDGAAIVKYSDIGLIVLPGSGGSITLTGAASVSGNSIMASAVGNQAAGTSLSGATGNILTLAGGIGLNGTSTDFSSESYFDGSEYLSKITADALVNNYQNNNGAPLDSITKQNFITALIPFVGGGSLAVSNNTIMAQTVGNEANNALLAPGLGAGTGGALNGVLAVGSMQSNQNSPLTATSYQSGVPVVVYGPISDGSVTANANTVSASATGNSVVNTVDVNSSNLVSYTGTVGTTYGERNPIVFVTTDPPTTTLVTDDFAAYADVTINNQQINDVNSPVTALTLNGGTTVLGSLIGGGVIGSTLSVTNNVTAAFATGNAATNSLALNGALVQTSAALLNAQGSYGAVSATLADPTNGIVTGGGDPLNSTLSLNGNLQRAIATGNSASNTLSVTGSSISVANAGLPASVFTYDPSLAFPIASDGLGTNDQTNAGFVAHNDQAVLVNAPITAAVTFSNLGVPPFDLPSMGIIAVDGLTTSTADNSMNAVIAAARGNQASTQLTVAPTASLSIYEGFYEQPGVVYSPFAVVANVQTLGTLGVVAASITSDAITDGPGVGPLPPIFTAVAGGLAGSTITMGGNQIDTLAQGNNATNGLTLTSAGTVTEPFGTPLGLIVPNFVGDPPVTTLTADAAFVVHNMQFAGAGSFVGATQDATGVQAAIAGNLTGSTVMIGGSTAPLGNIIASTATTNLASNSLTLGAANLSASGGVANFQVSEGATSSTMGETGTLPTAGSTNIVTSVTTSNHNGTTSYGSFTGDTGSYVYAGWLVSTDANSVSDGFTQGTGANSGKYYKHVGSIGDTVPGGITVQHATYGDQQSYTNTVPGTPGTWGSPGLVISLDGNVTNSVLAISQNTVNASSTANSANNTVASTSAISSSARSFASPVLGFTGPGAASSVAGSVVLADVGLLNNQTLGAAGSSTAAANGSFWISNAAVAPVYTNATLSISDNTQQASALGNAATNILTLSPGITAAETTPLTASILSTQAVTSVAELPVSASSTMLISAPMALTGSTLTVAGNSNTASAIANDVTSTLTVNGATSLPGTNPLSQIGTAQNTFAGVSASADYTVVNAQVVATSSVQSTANTTMFNNDLYLDPAAISNTSVLVDNNTTVAQALGNRASNMLTITAAGPTGATGAVANGQLNGADISATATINTTFAIGQSPGTQVGSSSNNVTYSMTNNATQALATGNQASNVLNASPTAYGTAAPFSGSSNAGAAVTSATYAVLNSQYNFGPVTASVSGVSPALLSPTINPGQGGYVMALNTAGTGNVVNMSGNTVISQAIGNRANNNIVLAALNTGTASSAINSVQTNTGAISASITNTQVGAAVSAGTVGRVANNQLTANAFGNVVTNSIVTH